MDGFGKRLIDAREKKGYNQKQFAEVLGITPTRLNYWEKDKREPDFYMFEKIVCALEADANKLLGLSPKNTDIPNIVDKYNLLNPLGKQKADEYIEDLKANPKYTQEPEKEKAELKPA